MDLLSGILDSFQVQSSFFSKAELSQPWAVSSGESERGIFHAVVSGRCEILTDGSKEPLTLVAGDIVFLPSGASHIMCDSIATPPVPIAEFAQWTPDGEIGSLVIEGPGATTHLLCGTFTWARSDLHPLLSTLPDELHIRATPELESWIVNLLAWLWDEVQSPSPGTETILTRIADVLVIYSLRRYMAELTDDDNGWLRGLADQRIGDAMALMHNSPSSPWTASAIATEVGMSRSNFFARFTDLVGLGPSEYLTRWRIHLAAQLLEESSQSVGAIALSVGYSSEAAFSKAFKRLQGTPPGHYRRSVSSVLVP